MVFESIAINIIIFILAVYSSCMIGARLFRISLRVPCPLLNHSSLVCYCGYSLKAPYGVIDNVQKHPLSRWLVLTVHDSSIADAPICG